ncbi:NAD-dependent epimerase/dehydratase family protein [Pseudonocardia spinosispora]|uniref:NAD-dependent epimerase/dehydratase family protein n=1 Tax=Pseudonocardia spinosispora TaxID=103441 RepID=UPI00040B0663|nr:NAD-dependent epimerase/dehydratase family protein [Pseudonocardia spinosispora]
MSLHVIVGAGAVGSATARLLARRGDQVRVLTRGGGGPVDPGIDRIRVDATDSAALTEQARGAVALYHCAAPPYWRWTTDFPPLADSLLRAAEATGAVLVSAGNLYAYGPVDGPITEDLPLAATGAKGRVRADMWRAALASHRAGRARVVEARASDYIGAGALSILTEMVLKPVARGRRAMIPADLDAPHSWTYTEDVAHTLIALADDERTWGRAWHVPSEPPISVRDVATRAAALAGAPAPRLSVMPDPVFRFAGLLAPIGGDTAKMARELREVAHQRQRPWVLDSRAATTELGVEPTPLDDSLRDTMSHIQGGG